MITQHSVLLMETLFLGCVLMIIIATNHAWEPVSQDLVPMITQQQYILPRTRSPWLIFCQSYFMMDALGKGLVELLEP